ncbi:MAG: hypothetical protein EOO51_03890 [Flavobacterium sp.]|nr:MAG: hypothetical protein EOO51_03890 [Flavobacterium sp.]
MKKLKTLLPALLGGVLMINCSGDGSGDNGDDCNLPAPEITTNSPVQEGADIILETPYVNGAIYYWTGPDGFESYDQNPVIHLATPAKAGTYSLELGSEFADVCLPPVATTTVEVIPAVAPCNPTNNTATNSVFPTMTFNSVLAHVSLDQYEINAGGSNGDLTFTFKTDALPSAGMYSVTSNPSTFDMADNGVNVSIVTGGMFSYFYRAASGDVYISYVNGHISATFCNLHFSGPDGGTDFNSSAKVTASN